MEAVGRISLNPREIPARNKKPESDETQAKPKQEVKPKGEAQARPDVQVKSRPQPEAQEKPKLSESDTKDPQKVAEEKEIKIDVEA